MNSDEMLILFIKKMEPTTKSRIASYCEHDTSLILKLTKNKLEWPYFLWLLIDLNWCYVAIKMIYSITIIWNSEARLCSRSFYTEIQSAIE